MYAIYTTDGALVTKTDRLTYLKYNYQLRCWVLADAETGRALQIDLGEEVYEANLEGREPYPWLNTTVRVERE